MHPSIKVEPSPAAWNSLVSTEDSATEVWVGGTEWWNTSQGYVVNLIREDQTVFPQKLETRFDREYKVNSIYNDKYIVGIVIKLLIFYVKTRKLRTRGVEINIQVFFSACCRQCNCHMFVLVFSQSSLDNLQYIWLVHRLDYQWIRFLTNLTSIASSNLLCSYIRAYLKTNYRTDISFPTHSCNREYQRIT